jgi:hypothetical protein
MFRLGSVTRAVLGGVLFFLAMLIGVYPQSDVPAGKVLSVMLVWGLLAVGMGLFVWLADQLVIKLKARINPSGRSPIDQVRAIIRETKRPI